MSELMDGSEPTVEIKIKTLDCKPILSKSIKRKQFLARRALLMGGVMKGLVHVTDCGIFLKGNTIEQWSKCVY
ncbi:hypothetical protein ABKV19_025396 [Rosa sericea]